MLLVWIMYDQRSLCRIIHLEF